MQKGWPGMQAGLGMTGARRRMDAEERLTSSGTMGWPRPGRFPHHPLARGRLSMAGAP